MSLIRKLTGALGAGTPETPVQQMIRRGDDARDKREWPEAAAAYRSALDEDADLPHIWVQLGHALKEQGDMDRAAQAYGQSLALVPDQADTHVHLAHLHKNSRSSLKAARHLLLALHYGLDSRSEEDELIRLLGQLIDEGGFADIDGLLAEVEALPAAPQSAPFLDRLRAIFADEHDADADADAVDAAQADDATLAIVFDISDLIGFWRNARLPTGIQRVQIEAIQGALSGERQRPIHLCCFAPGRDDWLEVPLSAFEKLAALATSGGAQDEADWIEAVQALDLHLSLTRPFIFPWGALLINLGTSWWLQNYFLYVRQAKVERGIRYIPFVHDMIPIMAPEHCTRALTRDFISWALGVFDHADHYLANSKATRADLQKVAATLGHQIAKDDVAVIPLDSDFRKNVEEELPTTALDDWGLEADDFVLFVSTIESRKGHLFAFEAWSALVEAHGADAVPQLVCVGNQGWLNDLVYERLASDSVLRDKVTMLSRLSDAELALLYRTCRFTIYPSLYEGWGLPVTESLCYGKVPLISDAASLPEAGGSFAVYAAAGSVDALRREAEALIMDDERRQSLEARIVQDFAPRSWSDLAAQIARELDRFAVHDEQESRAGAGGDRLPPPDAELGEWYSLQRNLSTQIWPGIGTTERFRSNPGWFWPEERGCRIKKRGAELLMQITRAHGPMRMMFKLRGDEGAESKYIIGSAQQEVRGVLHPDQTLWVWIDLPASKSAHECRVSLDAQETPERHFPTYFVRGFYLFELDDADARRDFHEAVSLDRLDLRDAYRDRRPAQDLGAGGD